nr:hypothetical protein [Auraticoccus monumenti]
MPHPEEGTRRGFEEAGGTTSFPSQGEAEAWLAESWADLADLGVDAVSLYEDDRLVYGPMGLAAG